MYPAQKQAWYKTPRRLIIPKYDMGDPPGGVTEDAPIVGPTNMAPPKVTLERGAAPLPTISRAPVNRQPSINQPAPTKPVLPQDPLLRDTYIQRQYDDYVDSKQSAAQNGPYRTWLRNWYNLREGILNKNWKEATEKYGHPNLDDYTLEFRLSGRDNTADDYYITRKAINSDATPLLNIMGNLNSVREYIYAPYKQDSELPTDFGRWAQGNGYSQYYPNRKPQLARGTSLGAYYPEIHRVEYINLVNQRPSVRIHELSHALNNWGSEKKIESIVPHDHNYWDSPTEIQSRLNEIRYAAGLKPDYKVTKQDLNTIRDKILRYGAARSKVEKDNRSPLLNVNSHDMNTNIGGMLEMFMNRYSDDLLLQLFNDVASTQGKQNPDIFYADAGGKIHINPKNRGKFNATKKRTGKTTEELTHSKNPVTRKRAIFAQNAKKWRH